MTNHANSGTTSLLRSIQLTGFGGGFGGNEAAIATSSENLRFEPYLVNGRKFLVPRARYVDKYKDWYAIPEVERRKLGKGYFDLVAAMRACFSGGQVSFDGPLALEGSQSYSKFTLFTIGNSVKDLTRILQTQKPLTSDLEYRLTRRESEGELFTLFLEDSTVSMFANKTSPLRIGVKRVDPSFVARYDQNTATTGKNSGAFTISEMISILGETRKYAEELLTSVNVPVTDSNVALLLQLLQAKGSRVVKECFTGMTYLKKHSSLDKNLAQGVGRNLSYVRMLAFNTLNWYPADDDELDSMLSVPYEWQVSLSG